MYSAHLHTAHMYMRSTIAGNNQNGLQMKTRKHNAILRTLINQKLQFIHVRKFPKCRVYLFVHSIRFDVLNETITFIKIVLFSLIIIIITALVIACCISCDRWRKYMRMYTKIYVWRIWMCVDRLNTSIYVAASTKCETHISTKFTSDILSDCCLFCAIRFLPDIKLKLVDAALCYWENPVSRKSACRIFAM